MKIAILAQNSRVAGGLLGSWSFIDALKDAAPEHQYLIFVPEGVGCERIELPPGGKFHFSRTNKLPNRLKFDFFELPKLVKQFKPERILGLGCFGILDTSVPQAIRIQNPYLVYPKKHYPSRSLKLHAHAKLMRFYFKKCLPYAQRVFCQTPVMKQRFCSWYGYDPDKVKILPNALSTFVRDTVKNDAEIPRVFKDRKKSDFYCFMLSRYYAHKNPEIILDTLCSTDRQKTRDLKFITTVTNNGLPNAKKFISDISKYNLEDHIIDVGRINYEDLAAYYRNVDLVVMPTLLESFSVTYLEAMHFGIPILTTDLDFARYICGDAAAYYDPWRPASFMENLLKLKSDSNLRKKLVETGREQLKKFSHNWIDMAKMAINELIHLE